jgi:drug/metabolite transporter (DMT)-like permease
MFAIALALGCSACYGVSNFLGPQLARRHTLISVLIISQAAALTACLIYLLANGHAKALPARDMWLALLAGAGNAGGLIGFYKAAELAPLAVVAPLGALGTMIPVLWGLAGGDSLEGTQLVGIVLAMAGAALAARRPRLRAEPQPRYPNPRAGAMIAVCSAVAFGVFLTALPEASAHGRPWALFDSRLAMFTMLLIWARPSLRQIELRARVLVTLTIPGLLLVSGTLMYTTATAHGQLSLVSAVGSLFPIFTVCLGVMVLDERLSRVQSMGVICALVGIVLIAV